MKRNLLSLFVIVMFSLSLLSCGKANRDDGKEIAEEQNEEKLEGSDRQKDADFAVAAADGGMMEVQLGRLAQTNASSAEVKKFAQMMVDEHSRANEELKALATQKNITLPATLSDRLQKKHDDLVAKKGAEFDKDYMDLMVSDHKDDIDRFEKEAENGNDPEIKAWASGKLATLRQHLEMAEKTRDAIKNKK